MTVKTFRFHKDIEPTRIDEQINEFLNPEGKEPELLADCKISSTDHFLVYTLILHDRENLNYQDVPVQLTISGESEHAPEEPQIIQG